MPFGQIVLYAFVTIFAGYVIYRIKMLKSVQNKMTRVTTAAEGHNSRVDEAIRVSLEQTVAIGENTAALKELIALNRQILENHREIKP
jgi:methyl-accepting chemotaxis protein